MATSRQREANLREPGWFYIWFGETDEGAIVERRHITSPVDLSLGNIREKLPVEVMDRGVAYPGEVMCWSQPGERDRSTVSKFAIQFEKELKRKEKSMQMDREAADMPREPLGNIDNATTPIAKRQRGKKANTKKVVDMDTDDMPGEPVDNATTPVAKRARKTNKTNKKVAGQPPVPLGGPEHGVVTYPHILAREYNKAKTPEEFFKRLMGIYFSDEELFRGNYAGGGAHEALNPAILGAILAETSRQFKDDKPVLVYKVVIEKCCRVRATHKRRKNKPVALPDANQLQQRQQPPPISTVVGDALLSL
ncbi:hypothetical protein Bbelb_243870 [Branchiostoma belcheri]|nr:hypothetical protein Bbelb_243870 [Branchiostoma belcheri]